jgi:hypothetical protein
MTETKNLPHQLGIDFDASGKAVNRKGAKKSAVIAKKATERKGGFEDEKNQTPAALDCESILATVWTNKSDPRSNINPAFSK